MSIHSTIVEESLYHIRLTWTRDILGPLISLLLSRLIYFLPCLLTRQEIHEELPQGPALLNDAMKIMTLLYRGIKNMAIR